MKGRGDLTQESRIWRPESQSPERFTKIRWRGKLYPPSKVPVCGPVHAYERGRGSGRGRGHAERGKTGKENLWRKRRGWRGKGEQRGKQEELTNKGEQKGSGGGVKKESCQGPLLLCAVSHAEANLKTQRKQPLIMVTDNVGKLNSIFPSEAPGAGREFRKGLIPWQVLSKAFDLEIRSLHLNQVGPDFISCYQSLICSSWIYVSPHPGGRQRGDLSLIDNFGLDWIPLLLEFLFLLFLFREISWIT